MTTAHIQDVVDAIKRKFPFSRQPMPEQEEMLSRGWVGSLLLWEVAGEVSVYLGQ